MHPSRTIPLPDQASALAALVLPAVREAVVVTDIAGRITYWNEAAACVFGVSAGNDCRPTGCVERLPLDSRADVSTLMRAMLDGVEWDGECEDLRTGRLVPHRLDARVRLLRQPDGATVGVLGIANIVTARSSKRPRLARRSTDRGRPRSAGVARSMRPAP